MLTFIVTRYYSMKFAGNRKITAVIVCTLLIFCSVIVYSNLHFHQFDDGFISLHGHPFQKDSTTQGPVHHEHTASELLFYYLLFSIELFVLIFVLFWFFKNILDILHQLFVQTIVSIKVLHIPSLRAPPYRHAWLLSG